MRYHLLFEQSGTFKNVIKEHGHEAYDYDILNDFGQTDYVIDLFDQIEKEYSNIIYNKAANTIFTDMTKENDFIIAFFPCTHFCDANQLQYRLLIAGKKLPLDKKSVVRLIKRNQDRAYYFELYLKFCFICTHKGIKTIIENPASSGSGNYLVMFSPIEVGYHEKDRSLYGDYYKKPTNFFAINFKMNEKFKMYDKIDKYKIIMHQHGMTNRSMISKIYAQNFYDRFLKEVPNETDSKTQA